MNAKHQKVLFGREFLSFPRIHHPLGRCSHATKAVVHTNEFISKFSNLNNYLTNVLGFSRISITCMQKATLKKSV